MFKSTAVFSAIVLAFLNPHPLSLASPLSVIRRESNIVFSPRITYPDSTTIWPMGSTQNVTWETADLPNEKHGNKGLVLLGYLENDSEHLDIRKPLATGFRMDNGYVPIKVPRKIAERDDYICVVFGDSGNTSQKFRITKAGLSDESKNQAAAF